MSEPTAGDRRQFLILILSSLLINVFMVWWTPRALRPSDAVPLGEVVIDTTSDSQGRIWGEPIAEPGRQAPSKVSINTADRAALLACPGIGPVTADRILAARREGAFTSWEDFQRRVPGFGAAKMERLRLEGVRLDP